MVFIVFVDVAEYSDVSADTEPDTESDDENTLYTLAWFLTIYSIYLSKR